VTQLSFQITVKRLHIRPFLGSKILYGISLIWREYSLEIKDVGLLQLIINYRRKNCAEYHSMDVLLYVGINLKIFSFILYRQASHELS